MRLVLFEEIMEESEVPIDTISFKVDAGLIDRLGRELVGRAETAVSELIKNSYDADARLVEVKFVDTINVGGKIIIRDNGLGMTFNQLLEGFMTISSTDKIHNPKSIRYNRSRAGKKGIGRFATQRLGGKLTIITQTADSDQTINVEIDWSKYQIDKEISLIKNPITYSTKIDQEGTTLIIENVRDAWSLKSIERVYRYVSDLLQPDYLSDRGSSLGLATQTDQSFKVSFYQVLQDQELLVADPQKMLFDRSIAIIEGYVDRYKDGFYGVKSTSLNIEDYAISINKSKSQEKFNLINNIHFKAYYFIYNRPEYYTNISKLDLRVI